MKKTPLRKQSKKRAKESRIYLKAKRKFLEKHATCECFDCRYPSVDVHHRNGRTGTNYLDEKTWMATCRACHTLIHENPRWARQVGFIKF